MGRTTRRVTDPSRGLTPEALAKLDREARRQLVQSLLAQEGRRVIELDRRADFDDFLVEILPLWRRQVARVRIIYRAANIEDLEELEQLALSAGDVETVLIDTEASSNELRNSRVEVLRPADLIERLEASPVVRWEGNAPSVDMNRLEQVKDLTLAPLPLDVLGLRWLPVLSLNKVPLELGSTPIPADALFEEAAFRVLTMVFRFTGQRLGSRVPGSRDPDALLGSPSAAETPFHAIVDCKAARDGYRMSADDERRFIEYIHKLRGAKPPLELTYLIIVSSFFPRDRRADPFSKRKRAIRKETGTNLVYLPASELARVGLELQRLDLDTEAREKLDWSAVLDEGRISSMESLLSGGD